MYRTFRLSDYAKEINKQKSVHSSQSVQMNQSGIINQQGSVDGNIKVQNIQTVSRPGQQSPGKGRNEYNNSVYKSMQLESNVRVLNQQSAGLLNKKQQIRGQIKIDSNGVRRLSSSVIQPQAQQNVGNVKTMPNGLIKNQNSAQKQEPVIYKIQNEQHSALKRSQQINMSANYQPVQVVKKQIDLGKSQEIEPVTALRLGLGIKRQDSLRSSQENATLFSQFKLKYDELKTNYDKLRAQHDDMTREKKKMEIKLLNSNPEYYEKQIKRLRAEVEKYQQQNQDNKYKYLQAENTKKELEASLRVKQEELHNILKQLEKQKISNVELKHQNEQKERVFNRIRIQFEKSSQSNSRNYDQAVTRANKLDGQLKTRNAEFEQLQKNYERMEKRFNEAKDEHKRYKEITDEKLKNLNKNLQIKHAEAFKQRSEKSQKIRQLSQQIEKYKQQRASVELIKTRKSEQVSIIKSNRQLELDVVRLQDRIRDLEYQLVKKDQVVVQLQRTINKIKIQQEVRDLEEKIRELDEEKLDIQREHERVKGELIREIDRLRLELMNVPQRYVTNNSNNFQEALRAQLQENTKLKKQLAFKIDQIYNLKSDIDELKVQKQNILSQMDVLKKIKKSEQKNIKIDAEIAHQHIRNDIQAYKRKIETLEVKLASKTKQVKEKDNFIMTSVLGRSKPEDLPLIVADFERVFQANYIEKLAEANKRIQDLLHQSPRK